MLALACSSGNAYLGRESRAATLVSRLRPPLMTAKRWWWRPECQARSVPTAQPKCEPMGFSSAYLGRESSNAGVPAEAPADDHEALVVVAQCVQGVLPPQAGQPMGDRVQAHRLHA